LIRIERPATPPDILLNAGKRKRRGHSVSYSRNPVDYDSGERTFKFDSGIYGHKRVKTALKEMQHDKCVFCESKASHIAYGDVEHFRPKGGFRQLETDSLERPGYYWLAYEWTNLMFSCQICNQRHKKNLFPLRDPAARARNHHDSIVDETPLFVDPTREDPSEFIGFRAEVPYGIDSFDRGETVINALGLKRIDLLERRRDRLQILKTLFNLVRIAEDRPEDGELSAIAQVAAEELERAAQQSAEYSAAVRAAIADEFRRVI
jgi:uncharacterized protein (TIGR02646 family)